MFAKSGVLDRTLSKATLHLCGESGVLALLGGVTSLGYGVPLEVDDARDTGLLCAQLELVTASDQTRSYLGSELWHSLHCGLGKS